MNLEQKIADKLFDIFYLDTKKYGVQIEDGSYRYIEGAVSPMLIQDSIEKEGSMLVYQELPVFRNSLVKWICLDVDIEKDAEGDDEALFLAVKEASLIVVKHLIDLNIPYVIEFSGRRGFHLWVFFDEAVDKAEGYQLVNLVFNRVKDKLPKKINIDLFPQTPIRSEKSKGVGKGVKLPLSKHKGSGFYAFLLTDLVNFNSTDKLEALSSTNLQNQLDILDNITILKKENLSKIFKQHKVELDEIIKKTSFLPNYKVDSYIVGDTSLEDVLKDLSKCDNIKTILDGYQKGLSEKDRNKLVGLLIHLRKEDDEKFGYNLLLELFSNIAGYDEQKTKAKLEGLKYFQPVSCAVLGKCSQCIENCELKSPVELISNVKVSEAHNVNLLSFNQSYFERIRKSLYSYSLRNDEVPLYPHLKKLEGIKGDEVERYIQDILKGGQIANFRKYRFDRREKRKIRYLYNIDPLNNVVSTYFAFLLNTFFYLEMSNNSYGYEFSKSLYKGNLYTNWFVNWGKYTREVEKVLFNDCYADYYLIKLDIRSFYDNVDLERLRIKLFEEAPGTVKIRLEQLSIEEKEAYRHLINYLIDISIKTTGEEHAGLPQGPAYARYLAEIYLLGLDKLIEDDFLTDPKREFYLRFVDDIFIFVENKERANLLFGKIKSWLSTNSLEINSEKTTVIQVAEFVESGAYTRFKDDQKYDINYANKNKHIVSEAQINKALATLRELADDADFGLKDNLRFFYSQFKDDKVLRLLKKKLAPKIAFSKDGRGALYYLFFQDLFSSEKRIFLELSKSVDKMEGLSLTHYLQALVMYVEDESFVPFLKTFVEGCLNKPKLTRAGKLLLTSLILKSDMEIPVDIDKDIIMEAIDQPNLKLTDRNWEQLYREYLQQITDSQEYFKEVGRIIDNHEFELQFLKDFANHVFTRFTEMGEQMQVVLADEVSLVNYYHIISFLTLFVEQGKENAIWEILLERSAQLGNFNYKEEHIWVDKISSFGLEDYSKAFYTLLFSEKGTNRLSKIDCPNRFLENYRGILTIVMFASDKSYNQSTFKRKLEEGIDDAQKTTLQKWVLNQNSTLYPNDSKIFLKNISLSGLIALKCDKEFYVKNVNNGNLTTMYKYIAGYPQEGNEITYQFPDLKLLSRSFTSLGSLSSFLNKLNEVFTGHRQFKEEYGYYPLLYNGYEFINKHNPVVPYFSNFDKVVDYDGNVVDWDARSYLEFFFRFLINKVEAKNKKINSEDNIFNFGTDKVRERFFISSDLIDDNEFEFKFLEIFCYQTKHFDSNNDFQYAWSKALYYYLKQEKRERVIGDFFKIHFEHYKDADIDIFFGVQNNMEVSKSDFSSFRNTLNESIRIFQRQVTAKALDLDFVKEILDTEFNFFDDLEVSMSDFKNVKLSIKKEKDYSGGEGEVTYISIDEKSYDVIKVFDHQSKSFDEPDDKDELAELAVSEFLFAKIINQKEIHLLKVPTYLGKCYDRIFERHKLAVNFKDQPERFSKLNGVFSNDSLERSVESVESFDEKLDLINKLHMHLSLEERIVERKLQNWLSMFNEKLFESVAEFKEEARETGFIKRVHECILKVLYAHSIMDHTSIANFILHLNKYSKNDEPIIALKHPGRDQNGLNQILTNSEVQRSVDFEKNFNKLCESTFKGESIVIISDIFLSGQQTEKAFKHYFLSAEPIGDAAVVKRDGGIEKYFPFLDSLARENFVQNLKAVKRIVFMAPFISEKFNNEIPGRLKELDIKAAIECIPCSHFKTDAECFFASSEALNSNDKKLFIRVFSHNILMKKIFVFTTDEWRNHRKVFKNGIDFNTVLRPQSLPAKHFKPFAWQVVNGDPLFKYRKNWSKD